MSTRRSLRRIRLEEERQEKSINTYNGRRKIRYCAMAKEGILGHKDLKKYEEFRVEIKREEKALRRRGIAVPKLPTENPTRIYLDMAKAFYYKYICPECEDDEQEETIEQPNLFRDLASLASE